MRILYLFFSAILTTTLFSQNLIYKEDNLHLTWGKKNYTGKEDISAKCEILSDGEKLILKINVKDDNLVLTNDPFQSDHVEIWLSDRSSFNYSSDEDISYIDFITNSSGELYWINKTADLDRFKSEIQNPLISLGLQDSLIRYNDLIKDPSYNYFHYRLVTSTLAGQTDFKKEYVFTDLTHLGLLPGKEQCFKYDSEIYINLEKMIKEKMGEFENFVDYKSSLTDKGYSITANIYPEAFGFISKLGLENVRICVNVIDVDKAKQESLLSTSPNHEWGKVQSFNKIKIKPEINVRLHKDISFLGASAGNLNEKEIDIFNSFPEKYFYSKQGWKPLIQSVDILYDNHRIEPHGTPNIESINFISGEIEYKKIIIDKNVIEYFSYPNLSYLSGRENYVLINNKYETRIDQVLDIFLLPSKEVAILAKRSEFTMGTCYSSGACGCGTDDYYYLFKKGGNADNTEYFAVVEGCSNSITVDKIRIEIANIIDRFPFSGNEEDDYADGYLKWHNKGKSLLLTTTDYGSYIISWDNNGENIKAVKFDE